MPSPSRRPGDPGPRRRLWTGRRHEAARARHIVITLGTPTFSHIEIDLSDIRSVLDDLLPLLRPGHALTLRSTIAPRRQSSCAAT
jgi:UDP-N-acetyl-D-mannosaminuronic acid dehydrogenase